MWKRFQLNSIWEADGKKKKKKNKLGCDFICNSKPACLSLILADSYKSPLRANSISDISIEFLIIILESP